MGSNANNHRHHTPVYSTPEEMQAKIDEYYAYCEGHKLTDPETGEPVLNKFGEVIIIDSHPLTMSGLAFYLGLSRNGLMNYTRKDEFLPVIQRARDRVEMYAEERLYDKDGCQGARFVLQNSYKHWDAGRDAANENALNSIKIINNIPKPGAETAETKNHAESTEDKSPADGDDTTNGSDSAELL